MWGETSTLMLSSSPAVIKVMMVVLKSSKSTSLFQPYKHLSIVVTVRPFIFHTLEFHHVHILLSFYYKHCSIVSTVLIPIKNFLLQVPYNFNVGWLKIIRPTEWCSYQNQQSPVYDMKWGHFDRVNSTFKMLLSSWNFDTVLKKIKSFDAKNLGSVE